MDPAKRCWSNDLGKLILRLAIGGLMLFHGVDKIRHGIDPIKGMMTANNVPEFLAYGVYIGEVLAPLLVILGFWTRPAALILAIDMIVAVVLVHREQLGTLNPQSGSWSLELQGLYFFGALAIAFLGAGCLSVAGAMRNRNLETRTAPPEQRTAR
jgi:putative oxidoreductase